MSELQPCIFMATFGAFADFGTACSPVKMLATHATKRGFFPSVLEKRIVPPIIKQPQAEENHGDKEAKNYGGGYEIHPNKRCPRTDSRANRYAELKGNLRILRRYF